MIIRSKAPFRVSFDFPKSFGKCGFCLKVPPPSLMP